MVEAADGNRLYCLPAGLSCFGKESVFRAGQAIVFSQRLALVLALIAVADHPDNRVTETDPGALPPNVNVERSLPPSEEPITAVWAAAGNVR